MRSDVRAVEVITIWTPSIRVTEVVDYPGQPQSRPIRAINPNVYLSPLYGRVQFTTEAIRHCPNEKFDRITESECIGLMHELADHVKGEEYVGRMTATMRAALEQGVVIL